MGRPEAYNSSFSVGVLDGSAGDAKHWDDEFLKLVGPELFRRPLTAVSAEEAIPWLREFARGFLRPGGHAAAEERRPLLLRPSLL